MAICTEATLTCIYCGKAIAPLLDSWRACDAGAMHEECWQEYLREMGALTALRQQGGAPNVASAELHRTDVSRGC